MTLDILERLDERSPLQTNDEFPELSQSEVKAALDRLASRSMLTYEAKDSEQVQLTAEGQQIASEGSHEHKVWAAVNEAGQMPLKELPV